MGVASPAAAVAAQSAATAAPSAASATAPGGALGENAFLQLLVAQLQYQNPLQPMSSTQFVTQLAQFQMLSDLTAMKTDLDALASAAQKAPAAAGASGQSGAQGSGSGPAAAGGS